MISFFLKKIDLFLAMLSSVLPAGSSLVQASGGYSSLWCGLLSAVALLLQSTGSWPMGSVAVAHSLNCSRAHGILLTRDLAHVPCIGRQILNHLTTWEAIISFFIYFETSFFFFHSFLLHTPPPFSPFFFLSSLFSKTLYSCLSLSDSFTSHPRRKNYSYVSESPS